MSCGSCQVAASTAIAPGVPPAMAVQQKCPDCGQFMGEGHVCPTPGGGREGARPLGPPPPQTPFTHPLHTAMHAALSRALQDRGWTADNVLSRRYLLERDGDHVYGQVLARDGDDYYGVVVEGSVSRGTLDEPAVEKLEGEDAANDFYAGPDAFVAHGEYVDLAGALEFDLDATGISLPPGMAGQQKCPGCGQPVGKGHICPETAAAIVAKEKARVVFDKAAANLPGTSGEEARELATRTVRALKYVVGERVPAYSNRRHSAKTKQALQTIAAALAQADLEQVDAEHLAAVYDYVLANKNANAAEAYALTQALVGNPTTPAPVLQMAGAEMAFGGGRARVQDIATLVAHANLDAEGQRILSQSPDARVRRALAGSPAANGDVLRALVKDGNTQVALAALRNPNSPYTALVERTNDLGIPDVQTLETIRRSGRAARDVPRCGVCGAWTKADGICNNPKCRANGMQTAQAREWPPVGVRGLGLEVPDPVRRRLSTSHADYKRTRARWDEARRGRFPDEWRPALPSDISTLVATGSLRLADGAALAWSRKLGTFTLDGIPVHADEAGDAVRTAYKVLAGQTWRRYRYSPGHGAIVPEDTAEPEPVEMAGQPMEKAPTAATPPALSRAWKQASRTRRQVAYRGPAGTTVVCHLQGSAEYRHMQEGDTWRMPAAELRRALGAAGGSVAQDTCRPVLASVHAAPPFASAATDVDFPNGAWVAADGFRMLVVAHEGDRPVPYPANVSPNIAALLEEGEGEARVGQGGFVSWRDAGGRVYEGGNADAGGRHYPDFVQIIPPKSAQASRFRLTGVPQSGELPKSRYTPAVVYVEGDDVYLRYRLDDDEEKVASVKIGEMVAAGAGLDGRDLFAVAPRHLRDVFNAKVGAGEWTVSIPASPDAPIRLDHDSGDALALVMPMHLQKAVSKPG